MRLFLAYGACIVEGRTVHYCGLPVRAAGPGSAKTKVRAELGSVPNGVRPVTAMPHLDMASDYFVAAAARLTAR